MHFQIKTLILSTCSAFLLVSCGPKKQEESTVPEQRIETPAPESKKPETQMPSNQQSGKALTPEQQEELKINEDNVMNPFPG